MAEMPAFPVIVTHLEDAPGSGLAACSGRPFRTPGGFSNFARWLCTGCARYARPASPPIEEGVALMIEQHHESLAAAEGLVLVRKGSGGVFPDGTTNHSIDFDRPPAESQP